MSRSWIVAHTKEDMPLGRRKFFDEWHVFESLDEAREFYDECVEVFGASIVSLCAVVESTDYESHELFREGKTKMWRTTDV